MLQYGINRRKFLQLGMAASVSAIALSNKAVAAKPLIKSFCLDVLATSSPEQQIAYYKELGVNWIQTFCINAYGQAHYPSRLAPVLNAQFLPRLVDLAQAQKIRVMGYFPAAVNTHWQQSFPHLVKGQGVALCIPFTQSYLDYVCNLVREGLMSANIDGFMLDWLSPVPLDTWLPCEKEMWRELLGERFPRATPSAEAILFYNRLSIHRAWRLIRQAAKESKNNALIWVNPPISQQNRLLWERHRVLKEADWILNESPDLNLIEWLKLHIGKNTRIVQCVSGWENHDASVLANLQVPDIGLYGYTQTDPSIPPYTHYSDTDRNNIQQIRAKYRALI